MSAAWSGAVVLGADRRATGRAGSRRSSPRTRPTRSARPTRPARRCTRSPTAACSASGWGRAAPSGTTCPTPHNDFIFAIIGEELGFVGAFAVHRAVRARWPTSACGSPPAAPTRGSGSSSATLTTWLVAQAAINIGYVVGLLPGDRPAAAADLLRRHLAGGHHVRRSACSPTPPATSPRRSPRCAPTGRAGWPGPCGCPSRACRAPPPTDRPPRPRRTPARPPARARRRPRTTRGRRRTTSLSVVVAGGGSAGHIEPALATRRRRAPAAPGRPGHRAGHRARPGHPLIPARGYPLELIPPVPLPRKPSARPAAAALARASASVRRAREVLREVDADVVVGFGGYVALPAYLAARVAACRSSCTRPTPAPGWPTRSAPGSPRGSPPRCPAAGCPARRSSASRCAARSPTLDRRRRCAPRPARTSG